MKKLLLIMALQFGLSLTVVANDDIIIDPSLQKIDFLSYSFDETFDIKVDGQEVGNFPFSKYDRISDRISFNRVIAKAIAFKKLIKVDAKSGEISLYERPSKNQELVVCEEKLELMKEMFSSFATNEQGTFKTPKNLGESVNKIQDKISTVTTK